MPVQVLEREVKGSYTNKRKYLPVMTTWKGKGAKDPVNMVRKESFLAAVKELVRWAEEIDVTRVGIVGDMHSGKTTMAAAIAHVIHEVSKLPWAIKILYEHDLMNFEATLGTLTTDTNWILRFDDVSFLDAKHNKKAIGQVKEAVTKIRHLPGGKDVKIILIYNYHYSKGLDKYLRMADFRFFTTVGSEEEDNMEGIMGTKMMNLVKFFAKNRQQGIVKGYFRSQARMENKRWHFYKWRNPFIPVLFWNNNSLRMIISPTREWMEPICTICSHATGGIKSEIDIATFCKEGEEKFKSSFKGVIKQLLREQGINCYSAKTVQMRRYVDRALEMKLFNLEDLALYYDLKETKTKMRKKLDGVLVE